MDTMVRPALAADAHDIGSLTQPFADYLRKLGDETELKLNAEKYLQDGFGDQPAFSGIVAERDGKVIGVLLYHIGYDSDAAGRKLRIADLFVDGKMRLRSVNWIWEFGGTKVPVSVRNNRTWCASHLKATKQKERYDFDLTERGCLSAPPCEMSSPNGSHCDGLIPDMSGACG